MAVFDMREPRERESPKSSRNRLEKTDIIRCLEYEAALKGALKEIKYLRHIFSTTKSNGRD